MVATLPLIISIGINILNIIIASHSSAGGKEIFFSPVFMSDKRKKNLGKVKIPFLRLV